MAYCNAKTRAGTKCHRPAGWGTDHAGDGKCKLHGGKSTGAPKSNQNATKFGFFSKIMPNDPETLDIVQGILDISPADMVWQNIIIQYTAIIRAQKLMFVRDQDDIKRHLVRQKGDTITDADGNITAEVIREQEWEFQYPWDRHASFMTAQSRAMSELRSLIKDFLSISDENDMRRLKIDQMKKEIERKSLEIEELKKSGGSPTDNSLKILVDYGDGNE